MKHLLAFAIFIVASNILLAREVFAPQKNTEVKTDSIDESTFAEWVDGAEKKIAGDDRSRKPSWVLWTTSSEPGHSGLQFGDSKSPGLRHLRVGFTEEIAVGSVLVSGGGSLSVLKTSADFPGDLANTDEWTPAQRIVNEATSNDEVDRESLAVWVLPLGTKTRALRFSHNADVSDSSYAGYLGSALVSNSRWRNLAPFALASAGSRSQQADRLNNGLSDRFKTWANIENRDEMGPPVSSDSPAWVSLTWPERVKLTSLNLVDAGLESVEWEIYTGPDDRHPRDAVEADWKSIGAFEKLRPGYPVPLWPWDLSSSDEVETRAIRLKITSPNKGGHSHIIKNDRDGHRVWLGEIMALQDLGDQPLTAPEFLKKESEGHAPIAVRFHLVKPGFITLVIEDEAGMRVRNLVSETFFPAGDNVAWWDGTNDLRRDVDAAKHGVYHIPAEFVTPGNYQVRGLVRDAIVPRYEFSIYSGGNPAWETADKSGGWLTNHTPPQAALYVGADRSPTGEEMIYLGSAVSEGGAGLAWVDLSGRKIGGRGWIGGNWTAAPFLAKDEGPKGDPEIFAYVGATWTASTNNRDRTHGELRITALTSKGDREVLKHPFTPPPGNDGDHHWIDQLGGVAVCNGVVVVSMNKLDRILSFEAKSGKLLGELTIPSPRGLAFDTEGHLLVLSEMKLLAFDSLETKPQPEVIISKNLEDPKGLTIDHQGNIFITDHGSSHQVKVYTSKGKFIRSIGKPGQPKAGIYEPLHMNHPTGIALDSNDRIWVTENDYLPKRVSVWNADGSLWKSFYGPAKYGGGAFAST